MPFLVPCITFEEIHVLVITLSFFPSRGRCENAVYLKQCNEVLTSFFFPHSVFSIFIVLKIHIQLNESYEFNSGMSWSWITFTSSPALSLSLSLPHFWPFSVDCLKYLCHHGADWSISLVRFLEAPAENLTGCVKPCVPGLHLLLSVYFRIFLSRPLMWFTGKLVYMYSVSRWVFR